MKRLDNGDLEAPRRGKPPPEPEGYNRDSNDPFVFHPDLVPCKYRVTTGMRLPCGKISCSWFCTSLGTTINQSICESCEIEPKQ